MAVFTANADGQAQIPLYVKIVDLAKPATTADSIAFADAESAYGTVGGNGVLTRYTHQGALHEDASWIGIPEIRGYRLYLASSSQISDIAPTAFFDQPVTPNSVVCDACVTGTTMAFSLPATNVLTNSYTHFHAVAYNNNGSAAVSRAFAFLDIGEIVDLTAVSMLVSEVDSVTMTLTMSSYDGASAYILRHRVSGETAWDSNTITTSQPAGDHPQVIAVSRDSLLASTIYDFQIVAVGSTGEQTDGGNIVTAATLARVRTHVAIQSDESSVTISWDRVVLANRYILEVRGLYESESEYQIISSTLGTYDNHYNLSVASIDGITGGAVAFRVRAATAEGGSPVEQVGTSSEIFTATPLARTASVTPVSRSSSSLKMTWANVSWIDCNSTTISSDCAVRTADHYWVEAVESDQQTGLDIAFEAELGQGWVASEETNHARPYVYRTSRVVRFGGVAKGTGLRTGQNYPIFNLPVSYRPGSVQKFGCASAGEMVDGGVVTVSVHPSGAVVVEETGGVSHLDIGPVSVMLDCVAFEYSMSAYEGVGDTTSLGMQLGSCSTQSECETTCDALWDCTSYVWNSASGSGMLHAVGSQRSQSGSSLMLRPTSASQSWALPTLAQNVAAASGYLQPGYAVSPTGALHLRGAVAADNGGDHLYSSDGTGHVTLFSVSSDICRALAFTQAVSASGRVVTVSPCEVTVQEPLVNGEIIHLDGLTALPWSSCGNSFGASSQSAASVQVDPFTGMSTTGGTLEAWVRVPATATPTTTVHVVDAQCSACGSTADVQLGIDSSLGVTFKVSSSSLSARAALEASEWRHIAGTFSATNGMRLYVDGRLWGENTASVSLSGVPTALTLRALPHGLLDEARVWSNARLQSEVIEGALGRYSTVSSALVGWFRFDGEHTTVRDASGQGNHGTALTNAVYTSSHPDKCGRANQQEPTLWWQFGESSGLVTADVTGGANPGSLEGIAAFAASEALLSSSGACVAITADLATNGAVSLNGVDASVRSASSVGLSGDAEFSVMAWIKWTGTTGDWASNVGIISTTAADSAHSSGEIVALTLQDGRVGLDFGTDRVRVDNTIVVDQWYHVAATKSKGTKLSSVVLYVDGVKAGSQLEGSDDAPNIIDGQAIVGRLGSAYFKGQIDDVRIIPSALSPDLVRQIALGKPPTKPIVLSHGKPTTTTATYHRIDLKMSTSISHVIFTHNDAGATTYDISVFDDELTKCACATATATAGETITASCGHLRGRYIEALASSGVLSVSNMMVLGQAATTSSAQNHVIVAESGGEVVGSVLRNVALSGTAFASAGSPALLNDGASGGGVALGVSGGYVGVVFGSLQPVAAVALGHLDGELKCVAYCVNE